MFADDTTLINARLGFSLHKDIDAVSDWLVANTLTIATKISV